MARANRHFISGYAWHLTHRCHKREFLLKFAKDKQRWMYWLFEAKKRFGLCVLNFTVTSNHLLIYDTGNGNETIPKSIQLIAGKTGQEFNARKGRNGAFWQDRYHATAVATDDHLIRCMVYIDLNMVRAGVVKHPEDWPFGGYRHILTPPKRYRLTDNKKIMELINIMEIDRFRKTYRDWVDSAIMRRDLKRQPEWTSSIAGGNKVYVKQVRNQMGYKAIGRKVDENGDSFVLREPQTSYQSMSDRAEQLQPEDNTI
ncbi:Transposase and inactivated derivatives, partial [Olavius algarvensis Delta 1 endosymbiont]